MLDHLGYPDLHDRVVAAVSQVLGDGHVRTPDLGGTATTRDMTAAIVAAL